MVFQRPVMLRRSALDNVALRAQGRRRGAMRERAGDGGARGGRPRAARARGRRACSPGGEQQRLALARAWALHPEVLFLDEPTANLDPSATREIEAIIRAFDAAGHQDRHVDAQPRPGAAPGRRGDLPAPGARRRARAGRAILQRNPPRPRPPRSSKENCHGSDSRALVAIAAAFRLPVHAQQRFITVASTTSTEQSRPLQAPAADLREEDRHPGARGGARHRAGARHGPARRRRRGLRARQGRSRRSSSPKASACGATR